MRFLKKYIRKLYHLIWFLSIFLFFVPIVYAEPSISNFSVNSNYIQPNSNYIYATPDANRLRFDVQSDGAITYIRSIFCYDTKVSSWYTNLPTNQLYDVVFYNTNQRCSYYNQSWEGYVMYFYATYEPIYNPSVSVDVTFNTVRDFSINLISYSVSHTPYQYIFSQPDESLQVNIDTNGIINSQNQSSQNIINNQDSNTQSIIDSSGSNTQSIIDNNNQNTQQEIESQKVCKYIDKSSISLDNKYLSINGEVYNTNGVGITNYININSSTIEVLDSVTGSANSCFYNSNKELISCVNLSNTSGTITIPNKSQYFRATISKSQNKPTFNICQNGNQALNDSINDLNDNITDSNIDSSDDTINNLKSKIPTNSVISDLLLLPVRFLQNFVNALGSSCSQFSLGSLYGTELFMPCINIENYLGSGIWTTIDLIISGFFVYMLRKKFIEIYENLTNLKNGGNEVD